MCLKATKVTAAGDGISENTTAEALYCLLLAALTWVQETLNKNILRGKLCGQLIIRWADYTDNLEVKA